MSQRKTLVADNLHLLRQGIELVKGLEDALYARREPRVYSFGVGSHLRHCVDFYELFLQALDRGRLDYDRRARDERVEKERDYAVASLERVARALEDLAGREGELPLQVKADSVGKDADDAPWSRSSCSRSW